MVYICVICSVKEPPLLPLSVDYRQLLEVIISPVLNIEELRAYRLLLCGNCVNLMQAVHNFQQTAATGVRKLKSLLIKHEENTDIADNAVFTESNPTKITIKLEHENELPEVSQEFVAAPSPDIIPLSVHSTLKAEPKTEDCNSDSTVSCVTKYEKGFDALRSETPEHPISPPQPTCTKYFAHYLQTPIPTLKQTSEVFRPATLTQVPQYKKIAPKGILGNTAKPKLPIPTNSLNSVKLIMVTRISNTTKPAVGSLLVNPKTMAVPNAGNITMAPGTNQTSNPIIITNATPQSADTVQRTNGLRRRNRKKVPRVKAPRVKGPRVKCPHCDKTLSDTQTLRWHFIRKHAEESPAKCDVCEKEFRNQEVLRYHKYTHKNDATNEEKRPELYCVECAVQFPNRGAFEAHRLSLIHTPRELYKFECEVCKKRYPNQRKLRQHMEIVHLGLRKHKCNLCDKSYALASGLQVHIKSVHEKRIKPSNYVCDLCGKAFTKKKSLTEHLLSHQGLRPYECKLCQATFSYSAALYTHNRLKHLNKKRKKKKATEELTED